MMFAYYFQLGLRSLRRNPALTALMVMAIGFGVAASMITWSVFRAVSGDPIPAKSSQLYTVLVDNRGPQYNDNGEPPEALTYTDATGHEHVVWFENAASATAKLDAAQGAGIGGVYLWLYGYEDTGVWSAFHDTFPIGSGD